MRQCSNIYANDVSTLDKCPLFVGLPYYTTLHPTSAHVGCLYIQCDAVIRQDACMPALNPQWNL